MNDTFKERQYRPNWSLTGLAVDVKFLGVRMKLRSGALSRNILCFKEVSLVS